MRASVGPYEVVRELGRGGMGVVYEVRRPDDPRRLALKLVLQGRDASADALTRFRREAEVLARVDHPSIVRVHSFDACDEGPYLVTDFVEGQGLDAIVRARFLAPVEAARLARALADGLAALHARGALHRDLKPANVIVRPDGSPVLLDFGLTRDVGAGERLTVTGALMGTPSYMAPEQARGASPASLGPAVDVYGLGATFYDALTSRPPFVGPDPMSILKQVLADDPPWPSSVRPDVPAALDAIVRRAMAKEPRDRHTSAASLRDELDAFLRASRPQGGARPGTPAAVVGALAVAAVVLLAIGGLLVAAWPSPPSEPTPHARPRPSPPAAPAPTAQPTPRASPLKEGPLNARDASTWERAWGWFRDDRRAVVVLPDLPGGASQRLFLWDLERREADELPCPDATFVRIREARLSRDRRFVAVADRGSTVFVVELEARSWTRLSAPLPPEETDPQPPWRGVVGMALAPDARRLAVGTHDGQVHLFDLPGGASVKSALAVAAWTHPSAMAYSDDGQVLFVSAGLGNPHAAVALAPDSLERRGITRELADATAIAVRDHRRAFVGTVTGMVFPIDDEGGQGEPLVATGEDGMQPVYGLAWTGRRLVTTHGSAGEPSQVWGHVRVWDADRRVLLHTFKANPSKSWQWSWLDVSPDGEWLLLTSFGGHVELRRLPGGS